MSHVGTEQNRVTVGFHFCEARDLKQTPLGGPLDVAGESIDDNTSVTTTNQDQTAERDTGL
jgi:hypothetical protein